ncbi:MAG: hypothetical protein MZU84_05400 [Sphingobacterium sp.]|nr:hypothetical protein [Sphingobacterium sp.]
MLGQGDRHGGCPPEKIKIEIGLGDGRRGLLRGKRAQRRLERGFGQHGAVQFRRRYFQLFDQFVVPEVPGFQQASGPAMHSVSKRAAGDRPAAAIRLEPGGGDHAPFAPPADAVAGSSPLTGSPTHATITSRVVRVQIAGVARMLEMVAAPARSIPA